MMTYIIIVGLLLLLVVCFFLFRTKITGIKNRRISAFKNDVIIHLQQNYPKIKFNYGIFERTKNEKDMNVRQVLIAENLALQFARYNYEFTTQPPIDSALLWGSYEIESNPVKNKRPNDLRRRKEYTYKRDHEACIRCGLKLPMDDATLATIKPFGKGGSYHFENLATLCKDCYKVLKEVDAQAIAKDSHILHELMKKVHF